VEGVCSFVVLHVKLKCVVKPSLTAARVGWIETLVQISPFIKKLLIEDPFQIQDTLASVGHSLIIVKFSGRIAIYHVRYECLKKVDFCCGSKLRSHFFAICGPKFTELGTRVQW